MEQTLETITGNLADGFSQLVPETWQPSAEICKERITNPELRKRSFYTANFGMYRVEDGEAVLYFGKCYHLTDKRSMFLS
ncbi:hypothetical protein HZB02_00575 [Candidatus Woesearchaeota archaeon]|nr:hypothetical protein [Candidatus Woesearchaeota archaeon]